mgnify:CR=1 FL=1
MLVKALFGAVLVQVALTLSLLMWLGSERMRSVRRREVKLSDVALSSDAWPNRIKQIANSFRNQFELPVLFYVAALSSIVTGVTDAIVVGLSWCFVVLRIFHAYVHVTHNIVMRRFQVYVAGYFVLVLLWVYIGGRVMMAGVF